MKFKEWTPEDLITVVNDYLTYLDENLDLSTKSKSEIIFRKKMWERLAVRPEMEGFWKSFNKSNKDSDLSLMANGGLFSRIEKGLNAYCINPRFTESDYKKEMIEIEKLATQLSNKIRKFSTADRSFDPFSHSNLLTKLQLEKAKNMILPNLIESKYCSNSAARFTLDSYLPSLKSQLDRVSEISKIESVEKSFRFRMPKKSNDKNAFRTYFIRLVCENILVWYNGYSPAKIAIFCSVALDDSEITPDLVRKLYVLDEKSKAIIKAQRNRLKSEDS